MAPSKLKGHSRFFLGFVMSVVTLCCYTLGLSAFVAYRSSMTMANGSWAAMTPLVVACQNGHEHVALLLMNEGCDVNFADGDGGGV